MSPRAELRPATAADIIAYFGEPVGPTVRAWIGFIDGEIAGIGGLKYYRGAPLEVFMDIKPLARKHPKALVQACRTVIRELRGTPARVIADPNEPKSGKLLALLGLKPVGVIAGLEVFTT